MKFEIHIDDGCDERVVVYAREYTEKIAEIERIVRGDTSELIGYRGGAAWRLDADEVECFTSDGGEVIARCGSGTYVMHRRLYSIEAELGADFVRINKSCIANIKNISRFEPTPMGALAVVFKSGFRDYVSRRQLKAVKERIGLK